MRNSLLFLVFLTILNAGMVVDKFGQKVLDSFSDKIVQAKELRLPYSAKYNPKMSISMLTKMIKIKPDYYRGYYNLGLAYVEIHEYKKSKESFDKALEIREKENIKDTTIFNAAGWCRLKAQDYKNAEILLKKGVELKKMNPKSVNSALFTNLGLLYFYTQRFDKALKYLKIAKDAYGSESAQNTIKLIKNLK